MRVLPDQLPWWIAGPLLGLLVVALFTISNQPLGASGAYIQTVKTIRRDTDSVSWRAFYFVGIFLGGGLATILGPGIELRRGYSALHAAGWSEATIMIVIPKASQKL